MPENKPRSLIPNSTQVPNIILDLFIPRLPEGEGRCAIYICRRTFGFHKKRDRISLSQFVDGIRDKDGKVLDYGTGLSRSVVNECLGNLRQSGAVAVKKDRRGNSYELNLDFDVEAAVKAIHELRQIAGKKKKKGPVQPGLFGQVVGKANQYGKRTSIGMESEPKVVREANLQKKGNKGKQSIMRQAARPKSLHWIFINEIFVPLAQKIMHKKPIVTGADARNLQRVLAQTSLTRDDLEQLTAYFLVHFAKAQNFSPSISTMFSAGIFNGLVARAANSTLFSREMVEIKEAYLVDRTPETQINLEKIRALKSKLASKFSMKQA